MNEEFRAIVERERHDMTGAKPCRLIFFALRSDRVGHLPIGDGEAAHGIVELGSLGEQQKSLLRTILCGSLKEVVGGAHIRPCSIN